MLYERYWEQLFSIAFAKCRDREMAEDCVQDVFVSLLNHKHPQEILNLQAYLAKAIKFSIVRSIYRYIRTEYVDEYVEESAIDQLSLEEALEEKLLKAYLFDKVEELPPQCRLIFKSSRQDHLSNQEIAEKLQISQRTVENQLSKAMGILRKYMRKIQIFLFF